MNEPQSSLGETSPPRRGLGFILLLLLTAALFAFGTWFAASLWLGEVKYAFRDGRGFVVEAIRVVGMAIGLAGFIIALRWGWTRRRLWPWALAGVVFFAAGFPRVGVSARNSAILSNLHWHYGHLEGYMSENPQRYFLRYDELWTRKNPAPPSVADEDYRALYPRTVGEPWRIRGPAGHMVTFAPDAITPQGYRDSHGDNTIRIGSVEVTFRDGVRHGPYKIYRDNGELRLRANYENGRVVGPVWVYREDGSRYDELAETK